MRLAILLLGCLVSGAALVFGENDPDFPQTQARPGQGQASFGAGESFGNSWRSDQPQTERRAAESAPTPAPRDSAPPAGSGGDRADKLTQRGGRKQGANEGDGSGGDGSRAGDDQPGDDGSGDVSGRVDLDTARQNFAALVEGYVSKRSEKGYWAYVVQKGRKARHLVEPAVDEKSVRRVAGARYAARVNLRDEGGGKPVALEFEADFSGKWKIVAVKPAVSSRR